MPLNSDRDWWRGAVIYQIYPRSFFDSNGDGIGDLPGIIDKLPYVAGLGVDAIWLSPFFTSPMKDFGYDVADYRNVDPMFGTLADFDRLMTTAHGLGLRVLIDQVLSHSAATHPWFVESRSSRDNPKADWYVWADPKADGSPPNNWLSIFGGSAWQWDSRREQYYLHNFLASQPDLNFHNPAVQDQLLEDVAFWLDRGVDGLRLDTVNFYVHDADLRDNPAWVPGTKRTEGVPAKNPYSLQMHVYDKTRPENLAFLTRLRALLDRYPGTTTVGEIGADDSLQVMADYTAGGDKLHMAYSFNLLTPEYSAAHIRTVVETATARLGDGWPCWSLGNHDIDRVVSRWGGGGDHPADFAAMLGALLLSLRGTACLYQGDELGLPEAEVPFEALQDPYGIEFWPDYKGRDGCRTPMPWHDTAPEAGFSTAARSWLPVDDRHRALAVSRQQDDPDSVLARYRRFLTWRKHQPVLATGDIAFIDAPEPVLAFERRKGDDGVICVFNLSDRPITWRPPYATAPRDGHGLPGNVDADGTVRLPAYGGYFATRAQ